MAKADAAFDPRDTRRHTVVVLVSGVDRRILPALRLITRMAPARARALHVSVDPEETRQLALDWMELGLSWLPLDIREAPADDLPLAVRRVVERQRDADHAGSLTVVVPELDFPTWWHQLLHRRNARRIAQELQSLPGVTTVIVPFWSAHPGL